MEKREDVNKIFIKTVNGVKSTNGLITIKVRIFDSEEEVDVFIVERDDFDEFLIGLDMIKKFKLIQDENLNKERNKRDENREKDRTDKQYREYKRSTSKF